MFIVDELPICHLVGIQLGVIVAQTISRLKKDSPLAVVRRAHREGCQRVYIHPLGAKIGDLVLQFIVLPGEVLEVMDKIEQYGSGPVALLARRSYLAGSGVRVRNVDLILLATD